MLFETFQGDAVEPLVDYLGPNHAHHLKRLFEKPIKVLGYQLQFLHGNWKLYSENIRDQYHGSLLHSFLTTFQFSRVTQNGGAWMDPRHRHSILWSEEGCDAGENASQLYVDAGVHFELRPLKGDSYIGYRRE